MNRLSQDQRFDCIIIGGGHNGLIAAAYLAKQGKRVCVLERRQIVGGCSVTEELWPGYKVSTAAYVVSLLLPEIIRRSETQTERFGNSAADSLFVYPDAGWSAPDSGRRSTAKPRTDRQVQSQGCRGLRAI